jgi:hypothetical protein
VETPPLVQSFPYVAWILLAALAFGSFFFVVVTRQLSDATSGYLRFSAFLAAALGLLALLVDGSLTAPDALVIQASDPQLAMVRSWTLVAFVVLAAAYGVLVKGRPLGSIVAGIGGLLAALGSLAAAALGWAPTPADAVPFLVQLVALSVVTGGSMAAVVLGHWYLVTPKISETPLILQTRLLMAAIVMQILLFITWTTLGGGPGQTAFSAFDDSLLLVALRFVVTLVFPLVLVYMAWRTAQTRSMESATGLLYINLAAVMAGTIGAAALYVSSGLLV